MGYAGGTKESPTYRSMGDHTEAVQLDYDPAVITYQELLEVFWDEHDPTARTFSRQYLNAVFYHHDEQRDAALAAKSSIEKDLGKTVATGVIPLKSFTSAEDYHQKYTLKRNRRLNNEMTRIYPRHPDFVNSTAVTRINGYAGGYGTRDQLLAEIDTLGLSSKGKEMLRNIVRR